MKAKTKISIMACITAALCALMGASVWEGAGAVAPDGMMSASGYYAATNSFPRNTVVDVTNLENDKTIRVIVVAGLDTPGLLAVLSKEAAGMIGVQSHAIARIRMSQPSDPIAFSRFTEGLAAAGFPDYDSGAPPDDKPPLPEDTPVSASEGDSPAAFFSHTSEPEWNETSGSVLAEFEESPEFSAPEEASSAESGGPYVSAEPSLIIVEEVPEISSAETPDAEDFAEMPGVNAAAGADAEAFVTAPVIPGEGLYDFALIPAEERPPVDEPSYTIDPDSIIPGLVQVRDVSDAEEARVEAEEFVVISGATPEAAGPAAPFSFIVPVISSLERGSYYVQLGAYSRPEIAETEAARISGDYPVSLFNAGSAEKPVYRILLGPLNLGESGAVLKRFKSVGYKDAFVRSGR